MKLRTLVLSVAVLAVLSAIAWFLQRPSAPAHQDARIGQAVFDPKMLEKTARIRLADQGKTVLLTKQPDGKWIDSSYFDLPADFSKLSRFTDDLANAKVQRQVTRNPERLARLEFKDTTLALLNAADKELWRLTLGKSAEGGGRFVKFDGEASGYLANLSVFLDVEAKNWADSLLVDLKPDDIAAVEVGFAEGEPVAATRAKKEDAWTAGKAPAGQRLKGDRITSLLSSFANLRFQDTSDLNDANVAAARQHSRTLKLTTFDHKAVTIELGRKPEEKKEIKNLKPEGGTESVAPKPVGEGGKSEVSTQKPAAGSQLAAPERLGEGGKPEERGQPAAPKPVGEGGRSEVSAEKPEAGSQTAALKPAVEGGKPEDGGQKSDVSGQMSEAGERGSQPANPEPNPSAVQSAKAPATAEAPAKAETPSSSAPAASPLAKAEEPKVETIPAGPVYAFMTSSDPAAPVNALMKKRAFQIYDWNFTSLPQKPDELFEPIPPPPPEVKKPEVKPEESKPEAKPAERPAGLPKS